MKRFCFFALIIIGLVSISFAQSGRRKTQPNNLPTGDTSNKQIETTDNSVKTIEPTGYSESATNQPISISVRNRGKKSDEKKKENKEAKNLPTNQTPTNTTESDEEVIKVDTTLVKIPVTVYQKNGLYSPSLSQQHFQIFEDGKEQEIAYFNSTDKPFTTVLVLDVSGSTSLKIEQIQNGAMAFVKQLTAQDKVMVISFDSGVHTLLEFSSDKVEIEKAIRKIRFGGGTSLYDAVDKSLGKKIQQIEGRKAVILFTDGVDTTSGRASYESTVSDALESDAVIFPIYLNTFLDMMGIGGGSGPMSAPSAIPGAIGGIGGQQQVGISKADYALGRRYLNDLANATGGRIFRPDNTESGLATAFAGIAEELRSQYEIGFYSSSESKIGDVKRIKIRIARPNLVIRNRDSYVVK